MTAAPSHCLEVPPDIPEWESKVQSFCNTSRSHRSVRCCGWSFDRATPLLHPVFRPRLLLLVPIVGQDSRASLEPSSNERSLNLAA